MPEQRALYILEAELVFSGPDPGHANRAAPEASAAQIAAIEAAQGALRDYGFTIVRTGHGARRVGAYTPSERRNGTAAS